MGSLKIRFLYHMVPVYKNDGLEMGCGQWVTVTIEFRTFIFLIFPQYCPSPFLLIRSLLLKDLSFIFDFQEK